MGSSVGQKALRCKVTHMVWDTVVPCCDWAEAVCPCSQPKAGVGLVLPGLLLCRLE